MAPKEDHSNPHLISLERVRLALGGVWLLGGGAVLVVVIFQVLLGRFEDHSQEAISWLLPTIMPTLTMILTTLGYTALDATYATALVRKSFFWVALVSSLFYLLLILLTVLLQAKQTPDGRILMTGKEMLDQMHLASLWLGPIQAVVASVLGVLFASRKQPQ
jgi:ABC-type Fe3+ transport system permease subunit